MKNYLHTHLDQIIKLVSNLKDGDIDVEKLTELDRSLELLSHRIKTARLDVAGREQVNQDQGKKLDSIFYFDHDYRILRFAGSLENIFGSAEDDVFPLVSSLFTPEDFEYFKERTKKLLNTNKQQSFDSKIFSKNKLLLPVHFFLEKVSFGQSPESIAAGMLFYQQSPSELNDYKEILLENLPGLDVYLFDKDFRHVLAGGREKKRLKLTNADFTGKTLFEVYDEKTRNRLFPFYRNALDGKVTEGEIKIKEHVYLISASPVYGIDKQVVGGALISQDIKKEKEIEKNLIKAKKNAEDANRAKSLVLANMSHEIRTPLNAIIGFTGLLSKTEMTPKQKKFSKLINQSTRHLLSVVNEILFLFKLGMGKVYIEEVPFNIKELVHNVHDSLFFRAKEKKLSFRVSVGKNIPEIVIGDPFRIKQILINLAVNAIKFTDKGEVNIKVTTEKETKRKVFLRFDISDTGIGISEDDINKIFEEFMQSSHWGGEKNRKGAGLGLTIVRKLVDLLKGRLTVKSAINKGSTFSVVIPFGKAQIKKTASPKQEYGLEIKLLKGKRILYADDDENNILLGESILSDWKVDYEIAYNGAEALKMLQEEKFDIALLDIQMPEFSGAEVVEMIKKQKESPNLNTRMLAVTANIMDNEIKEYLKIGFDDVVIKPFSEEALYSKICHLLDVDDRLQSRINKKPKNRKKNDVNDLFDTSELLKTAGGDFTFFNNMIDTFIDNAKDTCKSFIRYSGDGDWEEVGRKAHKAIPSFRYFRLTDLAEGLTELERLGLHEKNYDPMKPLVNQLLREIDKVISLAGQAKIPEEDF